jgi:exopolyphosphatase/guanosine-5'-triphosphate,3'-diphosphate pyrophosphatase
MDRHGVGRVRITATSAARDAENRDEFFDAAEAAVGARPELLAGEEEGRLSFLGATAELGGAGAPWLVVDIGGGSTELISGPGADGGPDGLRSLDVGCVRLTERLLPGDPPSADAIGRARRHVSELLSQAAAEQPALRRGVTMVGLAGTVACLAGVDQGLASYEREKQHHYRLERERVEEMLARLAVLPSRQRLEVPGVEPGRAEVIVGGAIVLAAVMEEFGFGWCLTSEADILDGMAAGLLRPGPG